MAERPENSVLFSLRELKNIEENRVREEEADKTARTEAERRAREDEIRKAKEIEERRRLEMAETERRRVDDIERQKREDQLRLEEGERKARVEAQMKLEEERLRLEMENRKHAEGRKKPTALYWASAVLVVAVVGLVFFVVRQSQREEQLTRQAAADRQRIDDTMEKLDRIESERSALLARLDAADTQEERDRIRADLKSNDAAMAEQKKRLNDLKARGAKATAKPKTPTKPKEAAGPKCDPNDPLCGI